MQQRQQAFLWLLHLHVARAESAYYPHSVHEASSLTLCPLCVLLLCLSVCVQVFILVVTNMKLTKEVGYFFNLLYFIIIGWLILA